MSGLISGVSKHVSIGFALAVLAGCAAPRAPDASRLTVAVGADMGPLNPYLGAPDATLNLVYDKLFEPSPFVPHPTPALAESAEQIDPLTWLVTVRNGITWHDGQPFTAADVAFTFAYYRDGPATRHGHHVRSVPQVDRVELVGDRQVRLVCGYPCPTLDVVTMADLPILPRHIWDGVTEPRKLTSLPIGTGPYKLVEYQAGRVYRFVANDDYFLGRPLVGELVMPVVPDLSATFIALRTGELDVAARPVPPELVREFAQSSTIGLVKSAPLSVLELRPNWEKAPFNRPELRRALSLGIDRQSLVDTVLLGQGRAGTRGYSHPDSPWSSPAIRTPFDRAQAAALLDGLRYADRDGDRLREDDTGAPLAWTIIVSAATPAWVRVAELVVKQYQALGLRFRLQALEAGVFNQRAAARDYDLLLSEAGAHASADPDQFIVSHQVGYLWRLGSADTRRDVLIERWKQAATVETRRQAAFALQELMNAEPTSIAVFYPDSYWAFRKASYTQWIDSPGYGVVHKWSFLPRGVVPGSLRPAQ